MTMSGADANNKSILITVANEAAGHMDAASGGGSRGGTKQKDSKSDKDKKEEKNQSTSLKKLIGIDISIAAMLKQSQIFTGFLGSVFQLIGMLVDVVLAPLAPYLFRLVEIVAGWIPKIAKWAEETVQWVKDGLDYLAEISSSITGIKVNATDLVNRGFQLVSLSGFGALIGRSFAAKVGSLKDWKLAHFFDDVFKTDDILKPIQTALQTGGKMYNGLKALFKAILGEALASYAARLFGMAKGILKGLGIFGLGVGIIISYAEFKAAWDQGQVGKALVSLVINILVIGVPIIIGFFFGGWVVLVVAIALAALAMWYEFAVPEETKAKIEGHFARFYKELSDSMNDWFGDEEGGFSKFLKMFSAISNPFANMDFWGSVFLTEGVKSTINEGVRSLLDGLVNGLIRLINSLITGFLQPFVDSKIGQAIKSISGPGSIMHKIEDFELIQERDFSEVNFMLGTSTAAQNDERRGLTNPYQQLAK